ncbi:DMT family transporter [Paenibacillus sp. y28]|uniref:DMT family transporter n=1 Tax=Paenibacillus sp. y28 TaxID=3129110 RepID=UPI0030161BA3
MKKEWTLILIAVVFEIIWVSGLKHADSIVLWLLTAGSIIISFSVFIRASAKLPIGTLYAVFTGLGTAGTVVVEMLVFGEPFSWIKIGLIVIMLWGILGLKTVTGHSEDKGAHA